MKVAIVSDQVFTQEQLTTGIRAVMNGHEQGPPPTAETQAGCAAFVRYYTELATPLPVDPVMLLINYERYQSALAAQAAKIECIPDHELRALRSGVRCAVVALQDLVGGTGQANADAIGLMARGIAEHLGRRIGG